MNYYEHHLADYTQATAHLSMVEDAAYSRMLRWYYANERPLPVEVKQVERLVRAQSKAERDAVKTILDEFFNLQEDGYHQDRADREIARYQDKQRKATESANARWNKMPPHSEGNANADADAMRTHSEGNAPQSPDPIQKKKEKDFVQVRFDEFWEVYPRREAKKAATKAWNAIKPDEVDLILANVKTRKANGWQDPQFIPLPATYLNGRRWEDETQDAKQSDYGEGLI